MASADQYVAAQNGAVRLALRDLNAIWAKTQGWGALERRRVLEEAWPLLVARYGELTAVVAADRFEELTGMSAVLADAAAADVLNARMRWGIDPLFGGAGDAAALARLSLLVDELVKQPGRDTMANSAAHNRIKVARVPVGKTCDFCLMVASRGFVYSTEKAAGALRKFHGKCDCRIATEHDAHGYDPAALRAKYDAARDVADGNQKVLSALRENEHTN